MLLPSTSPYLLQKASVPRVMFSVLVALLPALAAYVFFFGPIILVQLALATLFSLAAEALLLWLRQKPLALFLGDGSAIVTAWLIALTLPPFAPWWLLAVACFFAIVVAKHLYGGLGQNPFNPAMIAFAVCIVSFPAQMSQWPPLHPAAPFGDQLQQVFGLLPRLDALSGATPLDTIKTGLMLSENGGGSIAAVVAAHAGVFGQLAGAGWEWIAGAYLLGGLWLLRRGIITWQAPLAFIVGLGGVAGALWLHDAAAFANPLFHLFSGGAMLGAWFIVTDPVSGCTTPRGKLAFGFGAGVLTYVIRVFGGYPDGVAFAVLLLNLAAPLIDLYTQPAIFGMKGKER